jgi:hypothetical protein
VPLSSLLLRGEIRDVDVDRKGMVFGKEHSDCSSGYFPFYPTHIVALYRLS